MHLQGSVNPRQDQPRSNPKFISQGRVGEEKKLERRTARGFCFGDQVQCRLLVLSLVGSKLEKSELDAEHPAALIWGVRMF